MRPLLSLKNISKVKGKRGNLDVESYKALMTATKSCAIFVFTEHSTIQHINSYALNALGYTADELVGKNKFEALLTPGSRILFQTHFIPRLNLEGNAEEVILAFRSKKDLETPLLLNISVVQENDIKVFHAVGLPIGKRTAYEKELLGTIKNSAKIFSENEALIEMRRNLETHQIELENNLRETNRLNDEHNQLNKVLAHDFQEPMRKILFYADALPNLEGVPNRNRTKILEAALKIRTISESLQRFYSLDYKFNMVEKTDLLELIEQAQAESDASESHCDISKLKNVRCEGNPVHFRGLFKELFDNAHKFRHESNALRIEIASQIIQQNIYKATDGKYKYEDFLRITFSDNGLGFSNHHADKVFQLFQKLKPNEGLGIGLPYCKKIVELYRGSISVKSEVNRGTTFTILLPNFE